MALRSIAPQAARADAEVIVVSDGCDPRTAAVAAEYGAKLIELSAQHGLNVARNAGIAAAASDLIVLVDDDVEAPEHWLAALLEGINTSPDHEVFGGPIRARLEGGGPHACGREPAPITTLDLGPEDADAPFVWGANMALRRAAFERIGPFDEAITGGRGDEEEWLRRYKAAGGAIRYLAKPWLAHRRTPADARLRSLARAGYALGRAARRNDVRKGTQPSTAGELRVLAGCGWHLVRRRCLYGIVFAAHVAGRLAEARTERSTPPAPLSPQRDDFLSGTSGQVFGVRATSRAIALDALADVAALTYGGHRALARAARQAPRRRVLALGIERADEPNLLADARAELERSHHEVEFASTSAGALGKFENLNRLLREHPAKGHDWLLVLDDDVALPADFLDTFIFLAERFELRLAQPAHRWRSHAAWEVTRRRRASVARETAFVEIGPVVAFAAGTFEPLLPFPELRVGWGLDAHWSAIAQQRGWRIGVVDATPIRHASRRTASSYSREAAVAEARRFLADRPYTPATEAQRTLVAHRTWT